MLFPGNGSFVCSVTLCKYDLRAMYQAAAHEYGD
jgi:hypothetical protein